MVRGYFSGGESPDLDKWRVFVLCKFEENMMLQSDTSILHQVHCICNVNALVVLQMLYMFLLLQNPECAQIDRRDIQILTVDYYRVSMSDFIKYKAGVTNFTNGDCFYEYTKEEDLNYYKDVIYLPTETSGTSVDKVYSSFTLIL